MRSLMAFFSAAVNFLRLRRGREAAAEVAPDAATVVTPFPVAFLLAKRSAGKAL
jgi:hypothetical protein